jgi:hypothetical protein
MNFLKHFEDDKKINNMFQYMAKTKIKDKILQEDFIYNKQYVFKNAFDNELCNKIVKECCDINKWISDNNSVHYQYKFIDIDKLSIDTFKRILVIIYNKIPEISQLYELEKTQLEITEIVIIKNDEYNEYYSRTSQDVEFLKIHILLNSHDEFEGGNIQFSLYNPTMTDISNNSFAISKDDRDNKNINLEKGDMCIHGCLFYKTHNITKGCMYSLVGYIKPVSVLEAVIE